MAVKHDLLLRSQLELDFEGGLALVAVASG